MNKPYYQDDYVTLYNASCWNVVQDLGFFDAIVTDPPYGINFAGQPTKWQREAGMVASQWDSHPVKNIHWLLDMAEARIIWGGNYYTLPPARCWLSWFKPDAPPSMGHFELAWTNLDQPSKQICQSISATNAERVGHPTQKPLAVMLWALKFIPDAETIFDPFSGSGTTLVAAKQLGKRAVGIEICEEYCQKAVKRLQQEYLPLQIETKPALKEAELPI